MRTEAHQFKRCAVRLSIDQNEVRPDMTVATVAPLTRERMIEAARRKRLVGGKRFDHCPQKLVQLWTEGAGPFATIIAFEASSALSRPH